MSQVYGIDRGYCTWMTYVGHKVTSTWRQMDVKVKGHLLWTYSFNHKSDVRRRKTLGCLDQYPCSGLTLWISPDRETVYEYEYVQGMETMKQSGPETFLVRLALWWSYGGYVFPLVMKTEILILN